MDGILTTFALLAAVAGSKTVSTTATLVIGISTVLADALSMAAGEYLSAKAEGEVVGTSASDGDGDPGPLEKGAAMFVAFTLFGSMPLIGFSLAAQLAREGGTETFFLTSVVITAATLFSLGTIKSTFGSGVWWKSGLEVTSIGGAAATVAYYSALVVGSLMAE
jgi:VIT1/CCC1 family predicted Fe2+/Mn2+ transporter